MEGKLKSSDANTSGEKKQGQVKDTLQDHWDDIKKIQSENIQLKDEIQTEVRISALKDVAQASQISKLQDFASIFAKKIEIETKKMNELKRNIDITRHNLQKQKEAWNNTEGSELPEMMRKMRILDTNLEKINKRQNESLSEIKFTKEEINAQRRERVIYDNVFKKLETDLKLRQEEMRKHLFETMQVEQEKRHIEEMIKKLKLSSEKEYALFNDQYKSVFRGQENSILNIKTNNTSLNKIQTDSSEDKNILDKALKGDLNQMENSVDLNRHSIKKSTVTNANQSTSKKRISNMGPNTQRNIQFEVEEYELVLDKFKQIANVRDVEQFIHQMDELERENKISFDRNNELSNEIDLLELEIRKINKEIGVHTEEIHSGSHDDGNNFVNKDIEELKDKIQIQEAKRDHMAGIKMGFTDELAKACERIPEIYNVLNCQESSKGLPIDEGLNTGTIVSYLSEIEDKTNKILEILNVKDLNEKDNKNDIEKSFDSRKSNLTATKSKQASLKRQELKKSMISIVDSVEKIKESDTIMTRKDFEDTGDKDLGKYRGRTNKPNKKFTQVNKL